MFLIMHRKKEKKSKNTKEKKNDVIYHLTIDFIMRKSSSKEN
jgi:hypothetical protein